MARNLAKTSDEDEEEEKKNDDDDNEFLSLCKRAPGQYP